MGLPAAILGPLFWLDRQLPLEASGTLHIAPAMVLLLVALALVVLMNIVGAVVQAGAAIAGRTRAMKVSPRGR